MRPPRVPVLLLALAASAGLLAAVGCSKSKNLTAPVPTVPLSRVVISPVTDTLRLGSTRQFTALAYDTLSALVGAVSFQWLSRDPAVITVSSAGWVTARGEGSTRLVVQAGGRRDSATVFVYPDTGWFVQPNPAGGTALDGVFFQPDGRHGVAVGALGKILITADAGDNWAQVAGVPTTWALHSVWFTDPDTGYAVGDNSTMLRTVNGGGSWGLVPQASVIGVHLRRVYFVTPDTGWVAGDNGWIASTYDRGDHWHKVKLPTASSIRGLSFAGTLDGWAVGDVGFIARTRDGGASWHPVSSPTGQSLRSVWRASLTTAVAVGAQGTVLRTVGTPDSLVWQLAPGAGANYTLLGVCFPVDSTAGWAVGGNATQGGAALRSGNDGFSWTPQVPKTVKTLNDVFFVDPLRGWAVGEGGTIVHTARGGGR